MDAPERGSRTNKILPRREIQCGAGGLCSHKEKKAIQKQSTVSASVHLEVTYFI